jgi:membrane protein YdbS with pleckstrin-like domain
MPAGNAAMLDWLTWPANLLLSAGGAVASLFVSKNVLSFGVIQMMVATLVLAAVITLIVYSQSLVDYWRSHWKSPSS